MPSGVAQWWQYPTRSPSYRFTQVNSYIRELDRRFHALPAGRRRDWDGSAEDWPWWCLCLPPGWFDDGFHPAVFDGQNAHRGVNAARLAHGLPYTDTPPLSATARDGDLITTGFPFSSTVTWAGRPSVPSGSFVADLWIRSLTHVPERGPAASRLSWLGTLPILYDTPLAIDGLLAARPGVLWSGCAALRVDVCDANSAAFYGQKVFLIAVD